MNPAELLPQVYAELRMLAASKLASGRKTCSSTPTLSRWSRGAALHELVANWHSLKSFVRAKIVDLLRSGWSWLAKNLRQPWIARANRLT